MHKQEDDITKIIDGCKHNDRKAQELLYRSFYGALMNLCLRYTKNEADALEVLNSGFYKVYKGIHTYNASKAAFYTWARTIIINTCVDFISARSKQTAWKELEEAGPVDLHPEVFSKMSAMEILQLVRQLPPATQAVFNLFTMEGYAHKEIAALLHISEGTSKWHLSEARKLLQQMITQRND